MDIEYVTHASLLLKSDTCSLLTDPFYFFEPILAQSVCHFPPREFSLSKFGKINYLYSSHIHYDHSHPETLKQLKENVEIVLLPAERPELERRYRDIGYQKIILLAKGKTFQLNSGIEVTSYWDDPIDTILIVKMDGKIVLHGNDCSLSSTTLAEIASRFSIDYFFLQHTAAANLYPTLLPRGEDELRQLAKEKEDQFLKYQFYTIATLKPKTVIPYSMTVTYFQADQIHLNGYCRTTPPIFRDLLATACPEVRCWVLQPGDVIDTRRDLIRPFRSKKLWGENEESFLQNIIEYSQLNQDKLPLFEFGDPEACDEPFKNYIQQRLSLPFVPFLQGKIISLQVIGKDRKINFLLDTKNKTVLSPYSLDNSPSHLPFLEITMPASILEILLSRKCDKLTINISLVYNQRISFKFNSCLKVSPRNEVIAYILSLISIFDYELQQKLKKGDLNLDAVF